MSQPFDLTEHPHTRKNILTGDWILVSPHRSKRPWQGKVEDLPSGNRPAHDANCYLCPGNKRADGSINPDYKNSFVFTNDYSALLSNTPKGAVDEDGLLVAGSESGICKVICFSPRHDLTLPRMTQDAIKKVIELWQQEFATIAADPSIKYIQIFE